MALQTSGQIKLSEVAAEFGDTAPHALSEFYGKGNAPASGEIELATDFYGTSASFYDYQITNSLRFDHPADAYLDRGFSASNQRKWTWSAWVKISGYGNGESMLFMVYNASNNQAGIGFENNNGQRMRYYDYRGNFPINVIWKPRIRDHSAWYHFVVVMDSAQSTSSNRMKFYLNGELITDMDNAGWPSQNYDSLVNGSGTHYISNNGAGNQMIDGYLADVHFVDGQALNATSFGETKSGVWVPKEYTGTYGSNGFYLDFGGNTNDGSGNANNWTARNISSHDYTKDTPTNNFATFNTLHRASEPYVGTFEGRQGGLRADGYSNQDMHAKSTFAVSSGKWYSEIYINNRGQDDHRNGVGIGYDQSRRARSRGVIYQPNGNKCVNDVRTSYGATWTTGDIIGIALDADNNNVTFYKNGSSQGSISFTPDQPNIFVFEGYSTNASSYLQITANAGQEGTFAGATTAGNNTDANGYGNFKYSVPSGYLAPCAENLSIASAIDPASDNSPKDYFSADLYTGNGGTQAISGVGFQPDWLYIYERDSVSTPMMFDVLRGKTKILYTNSADSERTSSDALQSFNTDGFTVKYGNSGDYYINRSGNKYIAWSWKANGAGSSNSNGTVTSTVSANTSAGVSIVSYTGNGVTGQTIGHGLSQQPDTIWIKNRSNGYNWNIWHKDLAGLNYILYFNSSSTQQADGNIKSINSSVFGVSNGESCGFSGNAYIAYVMHEVDGFSSFGRYEGNGDSDGPFIFTGMRPAFVLLKSIDGGEAWESMDSARDPFNDNDTAELRWNLNNAETSGNVVDFLSNGFKIRTTAGQWNNSGQTYVYWAFAENPFRYTTAR